MLFEPESKDLESLGVSAVESLVSVDQDGHRLVPIPIHNYQGVCVNRLWAIDANWRHIRNAMYVISD